MATTAIVKLTQQLHREIEHTPAEYRRQLLTIVRSYRESVVEPTPEESFRRGWREAMRGETYPIETLWDGIETD